MRRTPHALKLALPLLVTLSLITPTLPAPTDAPPAVHIDENLGDAPMNASVIITFHQPPTPSILSAIDQHGSLHTTYTIIPAAHATLPPNSIPTIAHQPEVARIDHDEPLELHLDKSKPPVSLTPALWEEGYTGTGATIAVVDTGIDTTHPAVGDRVQRAVTFTGTGNAPLESDTSTDTNGHGTHVAGITGSDGARSSTLDPGDDRYTGMAPSVGLVSLDISSSFTTSTAIRAFEWIHDNHEEHDIKVVQNSWGRKDTGQPYDGQDPAIRASNTLVADDDLVVVFSAGNSGPNPSTLSMEASNPNVISVAATNNRGQPAEFSSRGPVLHPDGTQAGWTKPDLAAPGVQITSAASSQTTDTLTPYTALSGTSQASPHVGGIAAMIRAANPDLTAPQVHTLLERTARDLGPTEGPDPVTGHGMADAATALEQATGAANGTLKTTTEAFQDAGTLLTGTQTEDLLEVDPGASSQTAHGTFPVGQRATNLDFRFSWTSIQDDTPRPDLRIRLTDPNDNDMLVPTEDDHAHRTINTPLPGVWAWQAEPTDPLVPGAAEYEMNTTVTYEDRDPLQRTGTIEGGFFEDNWRSDTRRALQEAWERTKENPTVAMIAGAIAILVLLGTLVRRSRS